MLDCCGRTILLPHEDRVVLLWQLKTQGWVSYDDGTGHEGSHEHGDLGPLLLEMHSGVWVWQLVVEILILISDTMHVVMLEIILIHEVVVNIGSSIQVLWQEIESHIVPVGWLDLINRQLFVSVIIWDWEGQQFGIQESHLSLEEFVLTSVVMRILIGHT